MSAVDTAGGIGSGLRGGAPSVLVVEDNPADAYLVADELGRDGAFAVDVVPTLADALAHLALRDVETVVLDLSLPDAERLEALEELRQRFRALPIVVLTEHPHLVRDAIHLGAQAYLRKSELGRIDLPELVRRARERAIRGEEALTWTLRDPLTGLPNRVALRAHLSALTAGDGEDAALLLVDLDGFAAVNRRHGPSIGDDVLRDVAARLRHLVRPTDLPARIGGDEFAIVCRGVRRAEEALGLGRRIATGLADVRPVEAAGLSASVGVAMVRHGEPTDALMRRADRAVRAAKRSGAVHVARVAPRREPPAADAVLRALERREIVVVYQPIVDVRRRRIVAIEALARWQHPERGLLGADALLPLVTELNLHPKLTVEVVRRAAHDVSAVLGKRGADIDLFVNVDPSAFVEDVTPAILAALGGAGLPPRRLVLELTERSVAADQDRTVESTGRLRALGVRLAIDDFGVGHASLARVADIPFDFLKLDRSLISGVDGNARHRAVVAAAVGLGRVLGSRVIPEGIETQAELAAVAELDCRLGQGFLFGRPQTIDELAGLLSADGAMRVAS